MAKQSSIKTIKEKLRLLKEIGNGNLPISSIAAPSSRLVVYDEDADEYRVDNNLYNKIQFEEWQRTLPPNSEVIMFPESKSYRDSRSISEPYLVQGAKGPVVVQYVEQEGNDPISESVEPYAAPRPVERKHEEPKHAHIIRTEAAPVTDTPVIPINEDVEVIDPEYLRTGIRHRKISLLDPEGFKFAHYKKAYKQ